LENKVLNREGMILEVWDRIGDFHFLIDASCWLCGLIESSNEEPAKLNRDVALRALYRILYFLTLFSDLVPITHWFW
jgi:hypothetical protein